MCEDVISYKFFSGTLNANRIRSYQSSIEAAWFHVPNNHAQVVEFYYDTVKRHVP